jgi:serine/threonine protein kinase
MPRACVGTIDRATASSLQSQSTLVPSSTAQALIYGATQCKLYRHSGEATRISCFPTPCRACPFSLPTCVRPQDTPEGVKADYRIGDLLGKGSFGLVYAATNKRTGEAVAVKVMDR